MEFQKKEKGVWRVLDGDTDVGEVRKGDDGWTHSAQPDGVEPLSSRIEAAAELMDAYRTQEKAPAPVDTGGVRPTEEQRVVLTLMAEGYSLQTLGEGDGQTVWVDHDRMRYPELAHKLRLSAATVFALTALKAMRRVRTWENPTASAFMATKRGALLAEEYPGDLQRFVYVRK